MDMEATVILMMVEGEPGKQKRTFQSLTLEREQIDFLALTWTIVHPIDESSPLFGKTNADAEKWQAEMIILIKGFDETFSQGVRARYSYRFDEIAWNAKFTPAFEFDADGEHGAEHRQGRQLRASGRGPFTDELKPLVRCNVRTFACRVATARTTRSLRRQSRSVHPPRQSPPA